MNKAIELIAFYSRKLNPAQTTEQELLSIVETLKEFRTILLGQQLVIHTDYLNLTHKNFNSNRVLRWRLYIEEYSPEILYIVGNTGQTDRQEKIRYIFSGKVSRA